MILIDVDERNETNLPISKRKYINIAWLKFLSKPIRRILMEYYSHRKENELLIHMNGQVIYLEHILNHYFDPAQRGIYIQDATDVEKATVLYNKIEGNEKTYIYNESENTQETYLFNQQELQSWPDFVVNIPNNITFDEPRLRALINRYKLASKNYIIEII